MTYVLENKSKFWSQLKELRRMVPANAVPSRIVTVPKISNEIKKGHYVKESGHNAEMFPKFTPVYDPKN